MAVVVVAGSGFLKPIGLVEGVRVSIDASETHFHRGSPIAHGKEHGLGGINRFLLCSGLEKIACSHLSSRTSVI